MKKQTLLSIITIFYFLGCANPKEATDTAAEQKKLSSEKIEIANYWNQLEYDSMYHFILQERFLELNISADNPENTRNKNFVLNTSWDDDLATKQQFDNEGIFASKMDYNRSCLIVSSPIALLKNAGAVDEVQYDWFHPDQWFKSLNLTIYTEGIQANYTRIPNSSQIEIVLSYPSHLQAYEADGSFGRMTGYSFDLTEKYTHKKQEFWIKESQPGKIVAIADLNDFFKEYNDNYSEPFVVGDDYNLRFSVCLNLENGMPPHVKSKRKDPKYKKKKYKPRSWDRGNFNADLPSLAPYYKITIFSKDAVQVTAADLAF